MFLVVSFCIVAGVFFVHYAQPTVHPRTHAYTNLILISMFGTRCCCLDVVVWMLLLCVCIILHAHYIHGSTIHPSNSSLNLKGDDT
jgi:hypothetical protein